MSASATQGGHKTNPVSKPSNEQNAIRDLDYQCKSRNVALMEVSPFRQNTIDGCVCVRPRSVQPCVPALHSNWLCDRR